MRKTCTYILSANISCVFKKQLSQGHRILVGSQVQSSKFLKMKCNIQTFTEQHVSTHEVALRQRPARVPLQRSLHHLQVGDAFAELDEGRLIRRRRLARGLIHPSGHRLLGHRMLCSGRDECARGE